MNIPNSTQLPNEIFDTWLPILSKSELKVLMIIARQTLGWVEENGMRKKEDWMSQETIMEKTGLSTASIATATKELVSYKIIETRLRDGTILKTPQERKKAGQKGMKIFYRLTLEGSSKSKQPVVQKVNNKKFKNQTTSSLKSKHNKTNPDKTNSYKNIRANARVSVSDQYKNEFNEFISWYNNLFDKNLTPTRDRFEKFKARRRSWDFEVIRTAFENISQSTYHLGDNPSAKFYAYPEFLLRSDSQIDKWRDEKNVWGDGEKRVEMTDEDREFMKAYEMQRRGGL